MSKYVLKTRILDKPSLKDHGCDNVFQTYPDSFCIVYDHEECKGEDGRKTFGNGDVMAIPPRSFDIESISIKKGCQLTVNTGILQYILIRQNLSSKLYQGPE